MNARSQYTVTTALFLSIAWLMIQFGLETLAKNATHSTRWHNKAMGRADARVITTTICHLNFANINGSSPIYDSYFLISQHELCSKVWQAIAHTSH